MSLTIEIPSWFNVVAENGTVSPFAGWRLPGGSNNVAPRRFGHASLQS